MLFEFDALNVTVNDAALGLVTLQSIEEEKGTLLSTLGSECPGANSDGTTWSGNFNLEADFIGALDEWTGKFELNIYVEGLVGGNTSSVTSWSARNVMASIKASRGLTMPRGKGEQQLQPIGYFKDEVDASTTFNASGPRVLDGFFASPEGYGWECLGDNVFGDAANVGDVKVTIVNSRFQAFNMDSDDITSGPSGVLGNCIRPPDPMVTTTAIIVGIALGVAVLGVVGTVIYRRRSRSAYERLMG